MCVVTTLEIVTGTKNNNIKIIAKTCVYVCMYVLHTEINLFSKSYSS